MSIPTRKRQLIGAPPGSTRADVLRQARADEPETFVVHTFTISGTASVKAYPVPERAEWDETVIRVTGDFGTAPTGADLVVDILSDGVSIFDGDTSKMLRISAGSSSGETFDIASPDVEAGSLYTVEVKQVGSTQPGASGTIRVVAVRR